MPVIDRNCCGSAEGVARGAYILCDSEGTPDVLLIATGSEVHLAISAADILKSEGVKARVVSAPCLEWFAEQTNDYRESVLPSSIKARVSIEAGIAMGWRELIGDAGIAISLEHYGASASAGILFKEFGFTPENIVRAAKESMKKAGK